MKSKDKALLETKNPLSPQKTNSSSPRYQETATTFAVAQFYATWKSDFFHPSFSSGFRSSLYPQIVCNTSAAARTSFSERFLLREITSHEMWV